MRKELTIKEEQGLQLEILHFFDEICRKENIHYYAAYGTLLGAVRDHGFIDWDDDIDIWMKREECDRFIEVFPKYSNPKYFLQTCKTDKDFVVPEIVRICINNSYKWPEGCENESFHTGIYFDIFPLDYGTYDDGDRKVLQYCAFCHNKLMNTLKMKRQLSLRSFLRRLTNLTVSRKEYIKKMLMAIENYKKSFHNGDKLISIPSAYGGPERCIYSSKHFEDVVYFDFVDMKIPCPCGYDDILNFLYKNYMIPVQTKQHHTTAYLLG